MSRNQETKVLKIMRPLVTPKQAIELCRELYNFQATACQELVSYGDRNFLVTGNFAGSQVESEGAQMSQFLLKVTNSEESEGDIVEQQCRLMQSALEAGFKVQSLVRGVNGETVARPLLTTPGDSTGRLVERRHAVRLLSYLPGTPWGELPMTTERLESVAMEIGRLNRHLTEHFLTDKAANAVPQLLWSLLSVPKLVDFVQYVQGEPRQRMVREIVEEFCSVMSQDGGDSKGSFTRAFIHGDPNESNILVAGDPPALSGLLDWQESHSAFAVFDLAILIMHTSYVSERVNSTGDPFSFVAAPLIRGYTRAFPLDEAELRQLPLLVAARFAQCLTLGAYACARDPGNNHLLASASRWSTLDGLWNGHKNRLGQLADKWLQAV